MRPSRRGEDEAHGWRVEAQGRGRDVQAGAGLDAAVTKGSPALILRAVANGLNVVAVRVKDIAAEVVGVVPRTKTGRAVVAATCGERRGVERFDGRPVWCGKRNVHRRRGLAFRDEKINAPEVEAHRAFHLGHLDSERCKRGLVELRARRYVTDWDGEVVDESHVARLY